MPRYRLFSIRNLVRFYEVKIASLVQELERRNESVLESLCSTFEGVSLDAKHFRAHWFLPKLRTMIDQQVILANNDLTCIVDNLEINR